jgi:hypothetical protein
VRADEGEKVGRQSQSAFHHNPPWSGPKHSAAGGRTSVSAPMGAPPQVPDPMGSQRPWIGQEPPAGRSASTPPALAARWRASGPSPPPWGEKVPEGGMRGQPARQECFVSHPAKPPVPFALTPTLSHSHPRSVSRESFGGRGGHARRCRWVSHRSHGPTDASLVGPGASAGQEWGPPCGSPSDMDRPTTPR